jgi:hypothetical protein
LGESVEISVLFILISWHAKELIVGLFCFPTVPTDAHDPILVYSNNHRGESVSCGTSKPLFWDIFVGRDIIALHWATWSPYTPRNKEKEI